MKTTALRMSCMATLLLIPGAFAMKEAGAPDRPGRAELTAKITLPDGTILMARIEGLGCSTSICSRVAIKGKADGYALVSFRLDNIAAIRDITEKDALLVMKNGAGQRVSLVPDFRVLYLESRSGNPEKVDLAKIKSVEFQRQK